MKLHNFEILSEHYNEYLRGSITRMNSRFSDDFLKGKR